jgi:preprotein translocase subunit SecD
LYLYGTSLIRGFSVTLILGLLINLFTAVFVSRTIFMWVLNRKTEVQKLSI